MFWWKNEGAFDHFVDGFVFGNDRGLDEDRCVSGPGTQAKNGPAE